MDGVAVGCHSGPMERLASQMRVRGAALACSLVVALTVASPWATSGAGAAEPGPALLTGVSVQDMGTFDRVTFTFRTSICIDEPCTPPPVNPQPVITRAEYVARPVLADPSGMEVAVEGDAVLQLVMSNASGVDLSVNPPETTYTGPTRIRADAPNVIEVVETGDFESVLSWAIGVRSGAGGGTAQVLTSPTRVVVDIPHVVTPVVASPQFTG
jgi:hypothetical protein